MKSISQIINFKKDIEKISLNLFNIESELNVLELLNPIPAKIISILSNPELLDVTSKASEYIGKLHNLFDTTYNLLSIKLYKIYASMKFFKSKFLSFFNLSSL